MSNGVPRPPALQVAPFRETPPMLYGYASRALALSAGCAAHPEGFIPGLWAKRMTKNAPKRGSRRHLGTRDPPILTPRPILPQLRGVRTHLEPLPPPKWPKRVKRAQKGPKWLKMTKNGPKSGSRRHLGPRDPPILTPRPILPPL